MDLSTVGIAIAGLFLAGIIKGGTGLGFSSFALPFLVPAVGLPTAMTLVIAPALATNIGVALAAGHIRETSRQFWMFYVATMPGIAIGMSLLLAVDRSLAVNLLGLVVISYTAIAMVQPEFRLAPRLARQLQAPIGFANGILAGFTGSQVVPLLPYMMSLGLESGRMVQAINLSVIMSSLGVAVALAMSNMMSEVLLDLSLLAILPAILGVKLGSHWRTRISVKRFRVIVLAVLYFIGVSLLAH